MSLERKDVRFKLDPNEHEALKEVSAADGLDVGEWCEQLVSLELQRRASEARKAIALHQRLERLGISGNSGEKQGASGQGGERRR